MHRPTSNLATVAPLLAALALCCGCGGAPSGREARGAGYGGVVVAEVNGAPIFASQVDAVVEAARIVPDATGDPRRHALDLLISAELLYQAAESARVAVPEAEIDERLVVARSQFPSDAEFAAYLRRSGESPDGLRARERRRLMIERYCRTVSDVPLPDDAAARAAYDARSAAQPPREQVRVEHLLLRVRPGDPPEARREARRRADAAHRRALAGEPFSDLVREYSDSPTAAHGGDLGYVPRGRMLPEFERVAFGTPVGGISPVFETPLGFNVVRVTDRKSVVPPAFEDVKGGLLLRLARERQDDSLDRHVRELRARAEVKVLVADLPAGE